MKCYINDAMPLNRWIKFMFKTQNRYWIHFGLCVWKCDRQEINCRFSSKPILIVLLINSIKEDWLHDGKVFLREERADIGHAVEIQRKLWKLMLWAKLLMFAKWTELIWSTNWMNFPPWNMALGKLENCVMCTVLSAQCTVSIQIWMHILRLFESLLHANPYAKSCKRPSK